MRSLFKIMTLAGVALVLAGCETTSGLLKPDAEVEERYGDPSAYGSEGERPGAQASGVQGAAVYNGQVLDPNDPTSPLNQRVIYFDYDSAEVTPEGREILAAHSAYLASNPGFSLVLEGHTDERGSREYNIALGERRALSVRTLMLFLGAAEGQLQTVSYGEEKPVAVGHDSESWRLNRRVELVYPEYR